MSLPVPELPGLTLDGLAALPAADTVVLTVNNRLARRLVGELAAGFAGGRAVAEMPRIMPLSAWLRETADAHAFLADEAAHGLAGLRLDAFASQRLWADVIARAESERPLLDVRQAAALAADADRQIDEWQLRVPAGLATLEYERLAVWRRDYREALRRAQAEDDNLGYEHLLQRLEGGAPAPQRYVVLAGFAETSPRLARLLAALAQRGASLAQWQETGEPAPPVRVQADDRHAEWQAAAAWAAERLRADPQGRYAIVAAQLQQDAPLARRCLARTLAAGEDGPALAFNVAVGRPLADWPAVRAALAWLAVLARFTQDGDCPVPMLGAALLAGHCAGDLRDGGAHAAVDARWRSRQAVRCDMAGWARALQRCTHLGPAWHRAWLCWSREQGRAGADQWGRRLRAALVELGFPGERALDSAGYQVCEALEAALDRYAGLALAGRMDAAQAVGLLADLAAATPFQPQRDPDARLDVLGLLEAEGGRWDGIWALGLSDEVLPATPRPNPLLPLAVLRSAGAPRATPERERQWAEDLYLSLCRCAGEVVLSHPAREGERELRPAPMIAGLPVSGWRPRPALAVPAALEQFDDEQGLPLPEQAEAPAGGGLDVLDTQARNPLWAYVRHRLGARALQDYADAASASARGQFLHAALEHAWQAMDGQDELHARVVSGELDALIGEAVAAAAARHLADYPAALAGLECRRAQSVLAAWLALEAQRTPFTVDEVEGRLQWRRGPLALNVRLDRLDTLGDGSAVIVDYKTGAALPAPESDWSRPRPVNLQLPFYAAVLAGAGAREVAGVVLAQVHARQAGAAGLAEADLGLPGVQAPGDWDSLQGLAWPEVLRRWRAAIEALADEYVAGVATNRTLRRDDLRYCDALPFLRLEQEADDD